MEEKYKVCQKIGRREFLTSTGIATAGIVLKSKIYGNPSVNEDEPINYDIMEEVMKYHKIDSHCHVYLYFGGPEVQIDFADRLGIDKLVISRPITRDEATPEQFKESNDMVIKSVKQYPDRFIGQCTVNVRFKKESLYEIDRCVDMGMIGLKVYHQVKINDPLFYPVIEKCIDYKMIILMHSEVRFGVGGYRMKYDAGMPQNSSIPDDFVDIARRYPEAMFQYAHIGGGQDWEYACKTLRDSPNVWIDTSGSDNAEGMVDFALKCVGEDRLLFGADCSYYQSVGKILSANLNERQKKKIFFDNYDNILKKAGRNVE
jgi:predicted TIM-barrel fold metal-dependent hydrolase